MLLGFILVKELQPSASETRPTIVKMRISSPLCFQVHKAKPNVLPFVCVRACVCVCVCVCRIAALSMNELTRQKCMTPALFHIFAFQKKKRKKKSCSFYIENVFTIHFNFLEGPSDFRERVI